MQLFPCHTMDFANGGRAMGANAGHGRGKCEQGKHIVIMAMKTEQPQPFFTLPLAGKPFVGQIYIQLYMRM